jgi:hypothetical protein
VGCSSITFTIVPDPVEAGLCREPPVAGSSHGTQFSFINDIKSKGEGSFEADVWGALDGRIPPVYSRHRPRIPWIKAATLSAFFSIAV